MGKAKVVMTSRDVVFNNGLKMKAVVTPCFAHTSHSRQTFPEDPLKHSRRCNKSSAYFLLKHSHKRSPPALLLLCTSFWIPRYVYVSASTLC